MTGAHISGAQGRSVLIIGAGALGLGAAAAFTRAGWRVRVVDRDLVGHARGSSTGASRVLRCAHGPGGERYAELAWRARERWLSLGDDLFEAVGVVWLLGPDDPFATASAAALADLGVPHALRPAGELVPGLAPAGLGAALYEPAAGLLRADRCLAALQAAADITVEQATAVPGPAGSVGLDGGPARTQADVTVWACGAWLGRLFEGLAPIAAIRRGWVHLAAGADLPVVCEPAARAYLVPDVGEGLKVGPEHDHEPVDPDAADRALTPADGIEAAARGWLRTRLPALADAPLRGGGLCQYELTPDAHFLLAERPGSGGAEWLLGGGSGHGFKHAPVLGEALVAAVEGRAAPDPAWGLADRRPLLAPGTAMGLR